MKIETERPVIAFTSVSAPYGWLGNMSPYPITLEGNTIQYMQGTWRTAEALFQALRFEDAAIWNEIRACRSPMQAKMVAKANASKMTIEPRGTQDLVHMALVVNLKLAQHPTLKEQLREIPVDAFIVEDVTKRGVTPSNVFWGAALVNGEWVGENQLGRLWSRIRASYG